MFAGLAWSMDENSLREAFVKYGEVVEGTFAFSSLNKFNSSLVSQIEIIYVPRS